MDINETLNTILAHSEKLFKSGETAAPEVEAYIRGQFNKIKKIELCDVEFKDIEHVMRWHNILNRTCLTECAEHSKIGIFFDYIIDYYSSNAGKAIQQQERNLLQHGNPPTTKQQ